MEEIYKIYKIKSYNTKRVNYEEVSGKINYICKKLDHDRAYHLLYKNTDKIIVCLDIDHIFDESIFIKILKNLCLYFDIDFDDEIENHIFYTKSIKNNNEYSYHVSIPKYHSSCYNMRNIINHFKSIYTDISEYIDLAIYKSSNILRLPLQTNQNKLYNHEIVTGEMDNFVITYIPFNSKEYMFSNLCKYNILHNINNKIIPLSLNNTNKIIQQHIIKPELIKIL